MGFWVVTSVDGSDPIANPVLGEQKTKADAIRVRDERVEALLLEGFRVTESEGDRRMIYNWEIGMQITYDIKEVKKRKVVSKVTNESDPDECADEVS